MWDLPGPGLEPVSPELAGGFLTTVPPGEHPAVILHMEFANRPSFGSFARRAELPCCGAGKTQHRAHWQEVIKTGHHFLKGAFRAAKCSSR